MLKEVFRTVPIPYLKEGEEGSGGWLPGGYKYHNDSTRPDYIEPPYWESLFDLSGMMVGRYPTLNSPTSIFVWSNTNIKHHPGWGTAFWRFDGKLGKAIKRVNLPSSLGHVILGHKTASRAGVPWAVSYYSNALIRLTLGASATATPGEEPELDVAYSWQGSAFDGDVGAGNSNIGLAHFKNADGSQALNNFNVFAIDDVQKRFIHGLGRSLAVFGWNTGKIAYKMDLPDQISSLTLEDTDHIYILLANRVVFLFDYIRGEVLGASRLPPSTQGGQINLSWDPIFRRLLVLERVPDNPNGSCASFIRGYRLVPEPVRLTTPIPLKVPRQGRTIPGTGAVCGGYE